MSLLTDAKHYNHLAAEKTAAKRSEYQAWVHSHTPEQIHTANLARAQLRRILKARQKTGTPKRVAKLVDDRAVKQPMSSYLIFARERRLTSDFKGIAAVEGIRLIASEWKKLSAGEKKVWS
jgi:hypothetical protein